MSDKLLMESYLLILKSTVEVYVHGTLESSNEDSRKILNNGLDETLSHQSRVYDEIVNCGWYMVDNINPNDIECCIDKLNEEN